MEKKSFGNLIYRERTKQKISLADLTNGVCSPSVIQRLENGERLPDYFVLERIIERLGKSNNKIEFLYNETAYDIYYLRELIERHIEQKEYEKAVHALAYYEELNEAKDALHRQYIKKMYAVILMEQKGNHETVIDLLEEAMEQTVPNFMLEDLEHLCLGESELILLLLWLQEKHDAKEISNDFQLDNIVHYCHPSN